MGNEISKGTVSERAIAEMNSDLRKVFDKIRERYLKASKADIMARYDIGTLIKEAMADTAKYGAEAAEKLAAGLNMGVPTLYAHQQVAATWDRDELQRLLSDSPSDTGYHLSWSHAVALSTVPSAQTRAELVERCHAEHLQAKDLSAVIRQMFGTQGNNRHGRPRAVPRSPTAGLARMHRLTASLINSQDMWEEAIFDRLAEKPGTYANKEVLDQLTVAEEAQSRLEIAAKHNRQRIRSARDAVQRVLQSAQQKEEIGANTSLPISAATAPAKPKQKASSQQKLPASPANEKLRAALQRSLDSKKKKAVSA